MIVPPFLLPVIPETRLIIGRTSSAVNPVVSAKPTPAKWTLGNQLPATDYNLVASAAWEGKSHIISKTPGSEAESNAKCAPSEAGIIQSDS